MMEMAAPNFSNATQSTEDEVRDFSLEGEIAYHSLAEILQLLEVGKKTGLLSVQDLQPVGVIHFENGRISFAHTHFSKGLEAVIEILSQESGVFRFYPRKELARRNCSLSATHVLLRWAARMDENARV
jgi:hypothetical protein